MAGLVSNVSLIPGALRGFGNKAPWPELPGTGITSAGLWGRQGKLGKREERAGKSRDLQRTATMPITGETKEQLRAAPAFLANVAFQLSQHLQEKIPLSPKIFPPCFI